MPPELHEITRRTAATPGAPLEIDLRVKANLQMISRRIYRAYYLESRMNPPEIEHTGPELDYAGEKGKVTSVPQQVSLPNQGQGYKVGFGTIVAALAALSMAVLGHFFI